MAFKLATIVSENLHRLFEDEIKDPGQVVQAFFENYPLKPCYTRL